MAHEPSLTVYTITIKPTNTATEPSNRWLFRNIIGQANDNELEDSWIFTEVFRKFVSKIDTPEMYADPKSQKCMTANQANIADENVDPNLDFASENCIIEGRVEGGTYGRKRNKTSTIDKADKSDVNDSDAITDDYYFLLYSPLGSNKSILMLQSYSDGSIDGVVKRFWQNFLSFPSQFNHPTIKRFVPKSIIDDFKNNATVSSLTFSTDVPGETLLDNPRIPTERHYKVTVEITPLATGLSYDEFDQVIEPLERTIFAKYFSLGEFTRKKGKLSDLSTKKESPFDLGTDFEIQPKIQLSKFITLSGDESDFRRIKDYCHSLLEEIKPEIYPVHAVQER